MTALDELELRASIRVMEGRIDRQKAFLSHYQREGQLRFVDRTRAILADMHRDFRAMQIDLADGKRARLEPSKRRSRCEDAGAPPNSPPRARSTGLRTSWMYAVPKRNRLTNIGTLWRHSH